MSHNKLLTYPNHCREDESRTTMSHKVHVHLCSGRKAIPSITLSQEVRNSEEI